MYIESTDTYQSGWQQLNYNIFLQLFTLFHLSGMLNIIPHAKIMHLLHMLKWCTI